MLRAFLIILLYLVLLGYFTISYEFRDRHDRLRRIYLRGWQESDFQEFIAIGGIAALVIAVLFAFFK